MQILDFKLTLTLREKVITDFRIYLLYFSYFFLEKILKFGIHLLLRWKSRRLTQQGAYKLTKLSLTVEKVKGRPGSFATLLHYRDQKFCS